MSLADSNLLYREPQLYDDMFAGGSGRAELILQLISTYGPANPTTLPDLPPEACHRPRVRAVSPCTGSTSARSPLVASWPGRRPLLVDWPAALPQDKVVALAMELGRPSFEIAGY